MEAPKLRLAVLIDDNDIDLFVQKRFIEINRFADQVITFRSPMDALDYLNGGQELPEIIFLDLNMPVMDGFEFLERYVTFPEKVTQSTKVVVLTSSSSTADRERAIGFHNVIDFASKPLSAQSLERVSAHFQSGKDEPAVKIHK
jgi:two-component system, NarL family, nitrate/nitrite response regulator NarL